MEPEIEYTPTQKKNTPTHLFPSFAYIISRYAGYRKAEAHAHISSKDVNNKNIHKMNAYSSGRIKRKTKKKILTISSIFHNGVVWHIHTETIFWNIYVVGFVIFCSHHDCIYSHITHIILYTQNKPHRNLCLYTFVTCAIGKS